MKNLYSNFLLSTITISLLILPSTQFSKPQKNKQWKNGNKLQTRLSKQHHKIQRRSDPETAQLNAFLKSLKKNPVNQITSSAQDVIFVNNFENKKEQEIARQNLIDTIEKYKGKSSGILENIAPILKVVGGIEIAKKILGKANTCSFPYACVGSICCKFNLSGMLSCWKDRDCERVSFSDPYPIPYQSAECDGFCLDGDCCTDVDKNGMLNIPRCNPHPACKPTLLGKLIEGNNTLPIFDMNNLPGSETSQNSCPVVKSNNTFSIINTILIVGAITGYFGRKAVRKYGPKILNKSKKTYRQCFCSKPEINDLFKKEGNQNESTSSTENHTSDETSESESGTSTETNESESGTSTETNESESGTSTT